MSATETVACFQFEEKELGREATKDEMNELMKSLYGSSRGRQTKRALLESAEQLELEKTRPQGSVTARSTMQALDARLGGPSNGAQTQTGFDPVLSPRRAASPPAKRTMVHRTPPRVGSPRAEGASVLRPAGIGRAVTSISPRMPSIQVINTFSISWTEEGSILEENEAMENGFLNGIKNMQDSSRIEMTVVNGASRVGKFSFAQVSVDGKACVWKDLVPGEVVAAAGNSQFSSVATRDGHIIMYTPRGRRRCPPICIGSGISYFQCSISKGSTLMVVSTSGKMRVFDVMDLSVKMEADLSSILEGSREVFNVTLSSSGVPTVILNEFSAYSWHFGLSSWVKVADEAVAISSFYPVAPIRGQGEVSALQSKARQDNALRNTELLGQNSSTASIRFHTSRNHLEDSIMIAANLGSYDEFKAFLASYAHLLADYGDENRLRELADDLIVGKFTGKQAFERELVESVVLPAVATNRNLAPLLQRCKGIIDDLKIARHEN